MDAFNPRITARTMCIDAILVPENHSAIVYLISTSPFGVDAACGASSAVTP